MSLDMAKLSTPVTGYHGANQFSNTQEAAEQRKRVMNHRTGRRGRGREKGRERRESNHMLAYRICPGAESATEGQLSREGRTDRVAHCSQEQSKPLPVDGTASSFS